MIARLFRGLWCFALVVAAVAAWFAVQRFGPSIGPWAAALAAIAGLAAIHPLAIGVHFVASRVLGDPVPSAQRLSLWRAIKTYDAEIDASLRGVWFATPFLERRPAPPPAGDDRRRIALLFLHGYLCNRAVWHSFMRDAASRGYRCEAVTLDDAFASIDSHDDVVERALAALCERPDDRVAIVAHSMGGLVVRAALQRIDATRVAHVFTLGTPHHGTATARFGSQSSVAQMRRGSPWLAALAAAEAAGRAGLPMRAWTTIYSHHDDIVYPQSTGCLDGAGCVAIAGCGHVALLYDRRVRTIVFDRLAALETPATQGETTAGS